MHRGLSVFVLACLLTGGLSLAATQTAGALSPVSATLHVAAETLERFTHDAPGVVSEEDYLQEVHVRTAAFAPAPGQSRRLRSDVLIMADAGHGWVEFRDVFEVDKKPVRDRDDRLVTLFATPSADAAEQARRVVAEGARFNLDADGVRIDRTLNLPLLALMFLRAEDQPRAVFNQTGVTTSHGRRVAVVAFQETARPRLIASPSDDAAHGTFWVEPQTGQVIASELVFTSRSSSAQATARIRVEFQMEPKLRLWLPSRMEEHYVTLGGTIDGEATYSNYRRFGVVVEERAN
jgi:hypothetical protein